MCPQRRKRYNALLSHDRHAINKVFSYTVNARLQYLCHAPMTAPAQSSDVSTSRAGLGGAVKIELNGLNFIQFL